MLRQTLAAGSHLVAVAAEAQVDRDLDPIAGHQIYHAFNSANLDVSSALSHAARGHRQLDIFAQAMGIDLTGYGKNHEPPAPGAPSRFFEGANAADSVVAS